MSIEHRTTINDRRSVEIVVGTHTHFSVRVGKTLMEIRAFVAKMLRVLING
jgi:hypothetical protein